MALFIGTVAEPFTTGKVSKYARWGWQHDPVRAGRERSFRRIEGGYEMIGWESEIAICRAMGRGVASGRDLPPHPFDADAPSVALPGGFLANIVE